MTFWWCLIFLICVSLDVTYSKETSEEKHLTTTWGGLWKTATTPESWSLQDRIPMTREFDDYGRGSQSNFKVQKKWRRYMLPLLLAYKLKFFTLIPILVGGLLLLTATTGIAGFFFALFSAAMGIRGGYY